MSGSRRSPCRVFRIKRASTTSPVWRLPYAGLLFLIEVTSLMPGKSVAPGMLIVLFLSALRHLGIIKALIAGLDKIIVTRLSGARTAMVERDYQRFRAQVYGTQSR